MKKKKYPLLIVLLTLFLLSIFSVFAHSGRTDQNGGHWDRESGTYHFHTGEYAGKGSGGSSSNSEYVPFTPPYEPPTDNPYRNENTNSGTEFDIKVILGIVLGVICCIGIVVTLVFLDFEQNNGCLTLGISVILLLFLIKYLISEHPLLLVICATALIIVIFLIIKLKKQYDTVETDIGNYQNLFLLLRNCVNELSESKKTIEKYRHLHIPDTFEISNDKLPKDKNATHNWGKSFTLYKTGKGTKLHTKYNCCSAVKPVHIYWYRNSYNILDFLCKKCANDYKVPNMSWYEEHLKYERAKIKQINNEKQYKNIRKEIEALHKKCNSVKTKVLIIFSNKNKKTLQETNKKYREIQNRTQLSLFDAKYED